MAAWTFQRKLISGVLLICVLAILTSVVTLLAARALVANMTRVSTGEGRDLSDARAIQLAGGHNIADAHACLLAEGKDFVSAARTGSLRLRELANALRARAEHPEGRVVLDEVLEAEREHQASFERALVGLRSDRSTAGSGRAGLDLDAVLARGVRFDQSLTALVAFYESARGRSILPARLAVDRAETILLSVNIITIALLLLLCVLLVGGLSSSYKDESVARRVAEHGQSQARASLTESETASHLKDEFLAMVSHELRNPLAPILTWTQLLRSGSLDAEKTRRALDVIQRNVLSQAQLIDDLVDVSRVVSGKFRLDVRPVDLATIIRAAADAHGPASDAKHIVLQFVLDDRAGAISGDSERLQQVMWNLISNAIKFTPRGGHVQVVLQRVDSHVEVIVSDNGIGISPDFLPHVFEPFRQGTTGPMRRHSGLGLGLSIVRHIIELHGGEIVAHSDGLGLGSRFTVTFPVLATVSGLVLPPKRHPVARDSLAELQLGQLVGIRIMIVDDEPNASESLLVLFESCGAQARVANSAEEAMIMLEGWTPDVIVSDIAMPGEDGYSLVRRIRALAPERGGTIPAVALTAHAKSEDRVSILKAGFQMYLSKPADPNELVAVILSLAHHPGIASPV